jgi:hypothetical protein
MLNCREVSELISESLDHRISWWKRLNLWMHLSMCKLCARFSKDVQHLHRETQQVAQQPELTGLDKEVRLSPDSRKRIIEVLSSQQ